MLWSTEFQLAVEYYIANKTVSLGNTAVVPHTVNHTKSPMRSSNSGGGYSGLVLAKVSKSSMRSSIPGGRGFLESKVGDGQSGIFDNIFLPLTTSQCFCITDSL